MRGRLALRPLAESVCAAVILVGCGHTTAPADTPIAKPREHWPPNMSDANFTWTADPGIDVTAQPAAALRAYIESRLLVSFGGSLDYLYPGFDQAVAPDRPAGSKPASAVALWPTPGKGDGRLVGTERSHILRMDQSGREITAVVCRWAWAAAWQQPNGMYRINTLKTGAATGIVINRITLTSPAEQQPGEVAPQRGSSRYATTDVFAGWRVIGNLDDLLVGAGDPEWPEFDQDLNACASRAPDSAERREYLTAADRPRSDFPTLPASPGWPAQTQ